MTRQIAYLDCCFRIWILLSNSFLTPQWRPTTVPILAEEFGTVRSINTGFHFSSPNHQIKVFPSICFPALPGPCRQRSQAVTSLQSGMLTEVKEGACAGLSCLVWPIITDQTRLRVLLEPDSSTAGAESRSASS